MPLRAFLGATFLFAGLQKLANPAFFDASNPSSIQAQIAGAARRSPVHAFISPLAHVAILVGVVIALAEIAIGLGTLLGLWARAAAVSGAAVSFLLFLTVSYHSSPYYTGSDIVFVFAWLPFTLVGAGGVLSADVFLAQRVRRAAGAGPSMVVPVSFVAVRRVCGSFEDGRCNARRGEPCAPAPCPFLAVNPPMPRRISEHELDRRTFAAQGAAAVAVGAVALFAAGAAAALGRVIGGSRRSDATASFGTPPTPSTSTTTTVAASQGATTTTTTTTGPHAPPSTPPGTRIGPAADVPVGGSASFNDPSTGDPSLVIQPVAGTFLAFDAVCPHAGCAVDWDPSGKIFICPCHGSEFNGRTGAVETGPAVTGLTSLRIAEGGDGQLYIQ